MATQGHELYHALEIACEPSIVDARTLARFYARVRQELRTPPARSANGS